MELTPELLLRHAGAGPRYTSYPTAPIWKSDYPQEDADTALRNVSRPASVYVHIPFCVANCTFCGCNMVVAGIRSPGTRYLDNLERYVASLPLPAEQIEVSRIHLGGGTPTWLTSAELTRLYKILHSRFQPIAGAEISVEADPEITTDEQVQTLADLGVNRLSMGVQSFDATVLEAINRPQEHTRVHSIMANARELGMGSMNLDLIYGLPHQTLERFEETLTKTLEMRPDRLAVFGYAHVPWIKFYQRSIDADALPGPIERIELFLLAHKMLGEAGYQAIGMDHFALRDDELAVAQTEQRLHRNFMGYTTQPDLELIGLGMSAISEFHGSYVQHRAKLSHWWEAMEQGASLIEKGRTLTAEDQLRREVINRLMCNLVLPFEAVESRHEIRFSQHFAKELAELETFEKEGLLERRADGIHITQMGRFLIRNICMVFDAHLTRKPGTDDLSTKQQVGQPRFSQTV